MTVRRRALTASAIILVIGPAAFSAQSAGAFSGRYFSGEGDVEYLGLLDIAARMFNPDPEFQNVPMLYTPAWNGLVEGPTWGAWWIQNSYGTTYCALPFAVEPLRTFIQNAQNLWFDQMGDGRTPRPFVQNKDHKFDWVPPDGCLCDAASPGWFVAKQGDGRVDIHDWGMEFTAAGLLMQAELLLIDRDLEAIRSFLPKLDRSANFIESRRDPTNNLFLAGPAGNLLAPSYAGFKRPDGTYDKAYLTGLSITYIAALDRLIELHKLAGNADKVAQYTQRRELARKGLPLVTTDEGYFIKSLDPDGTRHGVYGADKYGYFEASTNHDAICFDVVDDAQAARIYAKLASIPGLRPHDLIIPNCPSLDDMYEQPKGLWGFGTWVNGGHWSTCEARMIMGYYRLGKFEDARRAMNKILTFARRFRMDNPLVDFGNEVYQPKEPINLCYDTFGPPAAMIRGLFAYKYNAEGLRLVPQIPPGITALDQHFPVRFGHKKVYLSSTGTGPIASVLINDQQWKHFDARSVWLPYEQTPAEARVQVVLGNAAPRKLPETQMRDDVIMVSPPETMPAELATLRDRASRFTAFYGALIRAGLGECYEAAHAKLAADCVATIENRQRMLAEKKIPVLPAVSQTAADKLYVDTARKLADGLEQLLKTYARTDSTHKKRVYELWLESAQR